MPEVPHIIIELETNVALDQDAEAWRYYLAGEGEERYYGSWEHVERRVILTGRLCGAMRASVTDDWIDDSAFLAGRHDHTDRNLIKYQARLTTDPNSWHGMELTTVWADAFTVENAMCCLWKHRDRGAPSHIRQHIDTWWESHGRHPPQVPKNLPSNH